jgi:hypothetical protein
VSRTDLLHGYANASRMRSWSRSGTASTSKVCRSRWQRTSASRAGARSIMKPARFAMWFRTICSRS